jgi:hypothetical protein
VRAAKVLRASPTAARTRKSQPETGHHPGPAVQTYPADPSSKDTALATFNWTGHFPLRVLIAETGPVTERLRVRQIDDDEGRRLVRIIRRGSGPVVTWRRAQMVLLPAQGMDVAGIAKVAFTSEDRVRDVIRNFNADGFDSLYPRYKGGRPPKFTLGQRREIKKVAKARPGDYDLPFPGLEPVQAGRVPGGRGGGPATSATRASGGCSARRASPFSA